MDFGRVTEWSAALSDGTVVYPFFDQLRL